MAYEERKSDGSCIILFSFHFQKPFFCVQSFLAILLALSRNAQKGGRDAPAPPSFAYDASSADALRTTVTTSPAGGSCPGCPYAPCPRSSNPLLSSSPEPRHPNTRLIPHAATSEA